MDDSTSTSVDMDACDGKFQWTEEMSVGNVTLDDDHKAFFTISNLIMEAQRLDPRSHVTESALLMLGEYVGGHFLREEKAMRAVKYPRITGHIQKHTKFRAHVQAIVNAYREGTTSVIRELPDLVVDWLRGHILSEDAQYKMWISNSIVDDRPLVYLAMEAEE